LPHISSFNSIIETERLLKGRWKSRSLDDISETVEESSRSDILPIE